MENILDLSVEVNVPRQVAYNQWTQFERFPEFMKGVTAVKQLDDTHVRWKAELLGREVEWEAEITEQVPDERIAWRNVSGIGSTGVVDFTQPEGKPTHIRFWMEYETHGIVENIADRLRVFRSRVVDSLEAFKTFIESRQSETGAWRGEVKDPDAEHRARTGASFGGTATHG